MWQPELSHIWSKLFHSLGLGEYLGCVRKYTEKIKMSLGKDLLLVFMKSPIAFISSSSMRCFSEKGRDSEATWMWQQTEISLQEMLERHSSCFGYSQSYLLLIDVNIIIDVVTTSVVTPMIHTRVINWDEYWFNPVMPVGWKVLKIYVAGFCNSPKLKVLLSCNVYFSPSMAYGLMTTLPL